VSDAWVGGQESHTKNFVGKPYSKW